MSVAGYHTNIKVTGTPTASTGNAMTLSGPSTAQVATINSTTRDIWDRTLTPSFFANGSSVPSSAITSINYLFGKVTFNSTQAAPVTVDVTYLPRSNVGGANSYTLTQSADMLDDTDFSSTGFRSRFPGLFDVSVSVARWDSLELDFVHRLMGQSTVDPIGTPVVVEVNPGGSSLFGRGYFIVEAENKSADVSAIESADLSFQIDGDPNAAFRWNDQ